MDYFTQYTLLCPIEKIDQLTPDAELFEGFDLSEDEFKKLITTGRLANRIDKETGETTNYRLIPVNSEINLKHLTVDDLIKIFCIKTVSSVIVKRFEFNHEVVFTEEMGLNLFDVARWLETNYDNDYIVHHFNIETV